jgi:hypothetical protein
MKFRHCLVRLRLPLIALAATAALAPATAVAQPADPVTAKWQSYENEIAKLSPAKLDAAFGTTVDTADAPAAKIGDTPADFPNASRAPEYNGPSTIEVVRPERTIVRDVDETLPIILASLALLIALAGMGYTLIRSRAGSRAVVGRTH